MDLDHKNIEAFKFLFKNYSVQALTTMKSLHISNERISEFPEQKVLQLFQNLESLTITFCIFPQFPSKIISCTLEKLKKIDLSGCNISSVRTLRPLGELKNLQDLNLLKNPITIDRISILNSLLFNGTIHEPCAAKKQIAMAYTIPRLILSQSKPATVPRLPPFSSLIRLSEETITEDEINTIQPKNLPRPTAKFTDHILSKVKASNNRILSDKEKYGSVKDLSTSVKACFGLKKEKVDTFQMLATERKYKSVRNHSESEDFEENSPIDEQPPVFQVPPVKESILTADKINEILQKSQAARDKASQSIPKKLYTFNEVSMFMFGMLVSDSAQVHSVCEVLSIVNGAKEYKILSEFEVYNALLNNKKDMSLDEMHDLQQILLLDDDMKNLRLKNVYFEWWLKKIEKRHIDFAEHQAILTIHKNRIFNNPLLGFEPQRMKRKKKPSHKPVLPTTLLNKSSRKPVLIEEEPKYVTVDFPGMFDPAEIKPGKTIFIKPIAKFESVLESLQSQMKEKERQFESLSLGEKVQWRLDKLKQNINDREAVREKLKSLFEQVSKMKKKFIENEVEYFYNLHEKKLDHKDLLRKHDYLKFELPKFIFPLIQD